MPRYGFVAWGGVCLVIAVVGFIPSYFAPLLAGSYRDLTPLMPAHTLSTGLWMLLIVAQPAWVAAGRVRQHRRNGVVGAVVAVAVIVTGTWVQLDAMAHHATLGNAADAVYTPFFRFVTLGVFAFAVWAALLYRHRPDWHKRLMLLGTFALLEAPLSRFYAHVLGAGDDAGLIAAISHAALMVLFVAWDRQVSGRFHPASLWGAIVITLVIFGTAPLAFGAWWAGVAALLAGVAG